MYLLFVDSAENIVYDEHVLYYELMNSRSWIFVKMLAFAVRKLICTIGISVLFVRSSCYQRSKYVLFINNIEHRYLFHEVYSIINLQLAGTENSG